MATPKTSQLALTPRFSATESKFRLALLGATGAGKTSLIDLFHNYVNLRGTDFSMESIKKYRNQSLEDDTEEMESKTRQCFTYHLTVEGLEMEIVDTPGLTDTRQNADIEANINSIIDYLKGVEYVNCICLVLNGHTTRFDEAVKQNFERFMSILPKEVRKNVIAIFTHTKSEKWLSFGKLRLRKELGFDVKLYYIENGFCGWENTLEMQGGETYEDDEDDDISKHLTKNFKSIDKMFEAIKSFKKIGTNNFGVLTKLAALISFNYNSLRAAEQTQTDLEQLIQRIKEEIDGVAEKKLVLQSHLNHLKTNVRKTEKHNTICDAKNCFSNCHVPCIFTGIIYSNVKECVCIGDDGMCKKCGHHYDQHSHQYFIFNQEEVQLRDSLTEELHTAATEEIHQANLLSQAENERDRSDFEEITILYKSEIAILLAEFECVSSKDYFESIIEGELSRTTSMFRQKVSKDKLADILGFGGYREQLIEIQKMPFTDVMSKENKILWACKTLDLSLEKLKQQSSEDALRSIDFAFRNTSRRHLDVIKEGNEAIQKRQVRAKDILREKFSIF